MGDEEYDILHEEFAVYPGKIKFDITLTNRRIRVAQTAQGSNNKNEEVIMLDDVTGCHVLQARKERISSAYLCVFSYPLKKKMIGSGVIRQRVTRTFTIDSSQTYKENLVIAEIWKMTIKRLLAGEVIKTKEDIENGALATRNLLVLVNPFSGKKKATAMYKEKVKPMFLEAEIKHTVKNTEYPGHAKEIAKNLKLEDWDGIVIVSGDGLVHEVINGLMDRSDWQKAIEMPIGIVPGGSGNALAASIVYASTGLHDVAKCPTICTFEICRGFARPIDLVAIETKEPGGITNNTFEDGKPQRNVCYSFMGLAFGLIADVDIESESFRCLGGELRNTVYGVIRTIFLRKYDVEISYPEPSSCDGSSSIHPSCEDINGSGDPGATTSRFGSFRIPRIDCDVPTSWVTIRDKHVLILANFTTHLATNVLSQRECSLDSGKILLSLHGCNTTRRDCLKVWDMMAQGIGLYNHDNPAQCHGKTIECKAFRIVPKARRHPITVDGELLPFGPIQGWVLPGMARVMCSKI